MTLTKVQKNKYSKSPAQYRAGKRLVQSMHGKATQMLLKAYSIRDSKGEIFHTPYFSKTHGEAERNFHTLVNDDKANIGKYAEDYDLYWIGDYDDQTGKFQSTDTPQHLIKAVQFLKQ